jgi:hypothetical protein
MGRRTAGAISRCSLIGSTFMATAALMSKPSRAVLCNEFGMVRDGLYGLTLVEYLVFVVGADLTSR